MTRAREHLIISCAPSSRRANGSFLSMLDGTLNGCIVSAESSLSVPLGAGTVAIEVVSASLTAPSRAKSRPTATKEKPDWQPFLDTWSRRAAAYEKARQSVPFLTPTLLKSQEEALTEAGDSGQIYRQTPALVVGDLAHRFLQSWPFSSRVKEFDARLRDFIALALPKEFESSGKAIEAELADIFHTFFRSKAYAEVARSQILGREVPLLIPWNGQIMEGVIDLIYEKNGLLYLADYKTDRVARKELNQAAERYRQQGEIYTRAVQQSLRRNVAAFKIVFLRSGEAVEITTERDKELTLFDL
jgi:ATP-dependent helicase/nuclease subunit A